VLGAQVQLDHFAGQVQPGIVDSQGEGVVQ